MTETTGVTEMAEPAEVKIAFMGAGSVVFTQGLLADLFAFPEFTRLRIALHDIDPERLATSEAAARHIAGR